MGKINTGELWYKHGNTAMMDRVGNLSGVVLGMWLYDGKTPHFHFYHGNGIPKKGHGGGCIMLEEARYFKHNSHKEMLNKKELEEMVTFLNSTYRCYEFTILEHILCLWNTNNPDSKVSMDLEMPDYINIKPYK